MNSLRKLTALGAAAAALFVVVPAASASAAPTGTEACGSRVQAYAPFRSGGTQIKVNGTYNNCNGRYAKVCVYLQVLLVQPPSVRWVPLANTCHKTSASPGDATFGTTGTFDQYAQFVGITVGYDGAGREVARHTGPVAAV